MDPLQVAIIGGGPGGLLTTYFLERRLGPRCEVTLFEASDRLGGKIVTRSFGQTPMLHEAGAAELYDYSSSGPDPLRELIAELGLKTRPLQGPTVILDDKFLTTDADIEAHCGPETRAVLQKFMRKARAQMSPADYYESDWQEDNEDPLARQTFEEYLAKVDDPLARKYITVAVHSDLGTEPHHTHASYGLQNYLMNEPDYMQLYTIEGGIESLPRELIKRIQADVLFNHRVEKVERTADESYRVYARHKGELVTEEFDFVVVALPNNWIPAIEWGGSLLAKAMHDHHAHYDYPAHYLRISILFEQPFWRSLIPGGYFMHDAFGGCCIYDESARGDHKQHGALGWLLAGDAAMNLANLSDEELIRQVLDSLPRALRFGRELFLEGKVYRWIGSVNGKPGGFPLREPDSRHLPEPVEHPWLFAVGDYLFDSTLNGVLDSADVVAEWIKEEIEYVEQEASN
ncbi:MAG TPA: FAD-dependent oxidoreductase [Pirellulales bacterium]|jgi:protoporphyrinogen oxidase|nr:FAD-dependent oxidoreductase [Pirellulales bacterium]